jgi:Lhr-like helicase
LITCRYILVYPQGCDVCNHHIGSDEIVLTRMRLETVSPDILFTTTEMLNQRLGDSQLHHLFGLGSRAERAVEMMLLDEVHTYSGRSGAQVAFLLRRWRKMLGGGMRQSGVLAAAALHALDSQVRRLADDHRRAYRLADGLAGCEGLSVEPPQTNIVFADVKDELRPTLIEHLRRQGVLATALPRLRFVTHLNVDDADIDTAVGAVREHLHA